MASHNLSLEEFRLIYGKVPRLTVEIVIQTADGIVFAKRSIDPWLGLWHLPGGTVFKGERIEQAVKRIAREEAGVEIGIEKFLGFIEYLKETEGDWLDHSVSLVFLVKIISGQLRPEEGQASEIKAFKELPGRLIKEHRDFLNHHLTK